FLAFHGQRRMPAAAPQHPEEEEPAAHAAPAHDAPAHSAQHSAPAHSAPAHPAPGHPAPGHPAPSTMHHAPGGGHLHDAPLPMAIALIVLAIGSVVAGWVGIGARFEHFLEPSFAPQTVHEVASTGADSTLTILSILAAFAGIGIATYYFLKNRRAADAVAARLEGVYRLLVNKYYVDEIYDAGIVQPIRIASEDGLWKIVDVRIIDGAVNGAGEIVGGSSELLRRVQTGSVRVYAASLFVGVVLILGYYLWP